MLELCDVVIPNEHELELVGGVDALLGHGVGAVVTTRGAAGVDVVQMVDGVAEQWTQPAFPVMAVDTTGAGDAFCGALAARLAAGDDLHGAVRYAAAAGALATTTAGAVASLPHADEVHALTCIVAMSETAVCGRLAHRCGLDRVAMSETAVCGRWLIGGQRRSVSGGG